MASKAGNPQQKRGITVSKRTSIGLKHAPLNKHKRRNWKRNRGQGKSQ